MRSAKNVFPATSSRTTWRMAALFLLTVVPTLGAQTCSNAKSVTSECLHRKSCAWKSPYYFPACERLNTDSSTLIFSAVAEKTVSSDGQLILDGKCIQTSLQTVVLRRLEVFRGNVPERLTVQAGDLNGFYFNRSHRYLVFATSGADGKVLVSGYGQTRELKDASDDVSYLRGFSTRTDAGEVFGDAFRARAKLDERHTSIPRVEPMKGVKVTLSGAIQKQATVDAAGHYRFADVPPGAYTLDIHSGPNVVWGSRRTVSVSPKGCVKQNFEEFPFNPEIVKDSLQPDDLCPALPR